MNGAPFQQSIDAGVAAAALELADCRGCETSVNTEKGLGLAGRQSVYKVLDELISILFPGCHGHAPMAEERLKDTIERLLVKLTKGTPGFRQS